MSLIHKNLETHVNGGLYPDRSRTLDSSKEASFRNSPYKPLVFRVFHDTGKYCDKPQLFDIEFE